MDRSAEMLAACAQLAEHGYALIENVLDAGPLALARERVTERMAWERANPLPADGTVHDDDAEIAAYYRAHYTVSDAEALRMVTRTHQYRRDNADTRWPVPIAQVSKNFLHLPTLFDQDRSQRVWNLIDKCPELIWMIEHPLVLPIARGMLGPDCNLHDFESNSIGAHTGGGAWHIDAPLGQMPLPLPEAPLMMQTVYMLDDFSAANGATRVVPDSHKLRRPPPWGSEPIDGEVVLEAPAGSVAMWLSHTWHRSGPNQTDGARRALLCNYNVSWMRPFADFTSTLPSEVLPTLSNDARYLLGFAARAPRTR